MEYGLDSELTFKCNIMGKKWIEKHYNKNFNQQITMDF
jgi:hypothetical protein